MIRKGRAAPSSEHAARRFDARDTRREAATGAQAQAGVDPLDPSSYEQAPESSSRALEQGRRSRQPVRSLKMRAIGYLSRREYSRAELARKLAPFIEEGDALDPLLDSLEREGWLSDARFAESVMNRRSGRMGASRIVSELRQHGLDGALIDSVGSQLRDTERARALAVWRKKFGALPQSPVERAKQARFLAMRGFSRATISQILKGEDVWGDD